VIRAWVVVAIAAATLWGIDAAHVDWGFLPPATCMPDHCFCEAVRPFGVRQLANTWSNLGFIFVGALVWPRSSSWRARSRGLGAPGRSAAPRSGFASSSPALARPFGAVTAFLGVASAAYHASMSFPGQWIDNVSMYLFPTLVLVRSVVPYLLVNVALAAAVWLWPDARRWAFAALVVALGTKELVWRRPSLRWLGAAAATLAASFLVWNLDQRQVICWGHAAWHLGNAAAAGFLYLHVSQKLPTAGA
jgi:hypothetical protein